MHRVAILAALLNAAREATTRGGGDWSMRPILVLLVGSHLLVALCTALVNSELFGRNWVRDALVCSGSAKCDTATNAAILPEELSLCRKPILRKSCLTGVLRGTGIGTSSG
jgi:hypothetical protein